MSSPFPGMDPYLEDPAFWSGFHSRFIVAVSAALTHVLPKGYYADVEQHVWLQGDEIDEREPFAIPDSYIAGSGGTAAPTMTASRPDTEVTLPKPARRRGHKYVTITDRASNRVITVIELLSPSNKEPGDDRESYLRKRAEYLLSGTNLVEIDLLRDGDRLPFGRPKPPLADYYALISRADRFPKASVWAFTVRDPLPVLPIPLRPPDGEVLLNLRACLDRSYEDAGYQSRIDYQRSPAFPLRQADAEWATQHVKPNTP